MIIVGLDLETTGLKVDKGDRIIEVCIGIYRLLETGHVEHLKTITQRINPQRSISLEAQRVHGIALEDLEGMPVWADFAPKINQILERADLLVIHNARFDAPFLGKEQADAGHPITCAVPTLCTMEEGRWATFDGKNPSLKELSYALEIEYDQTKAHAASYDVGVMMECFAKGLQLGLFTLPKEGNNGNQE